MMIPLHEPQFDAADEQAVLRTLRTAWVSTGGPDVTAFEDQFARYVGAPYAVSVCNGTAGLALAIEVLARTRKVKAGFAVLVPNLTFIGTISAVAQAGGVPCLFDTAPASLNSDALSVEKALRSQFLRTKTGWIHKNLDVPLLAIMPAHIMGWGSQMPTIAQFCKDNSIDLIEDAAESLGSFDSDYRHLGNLGIMSVFSFNGNKILTTGGGGMVITHDAQMAHRLKHLSTTAKTDALRYEHDELGFNYRLVNILAALGVSQLDKLPSRLDRKKSIFQAYQSGLASDVRLKIYHETGQVHPNHWLVNLVCESESQRDRILACLMESKVQARPLWKCNHLQPALKDLSHFYKDTEFGNSVEMWQRTLSLPSSAQLSQAQIDFICELILKSA